MSHALIDSYPGLVCDLDGVVFAGSKPVPDAAESITAIQKAGISVLFATNNASRSPSAVAKKLAQFGVKVAADHCITSATVGASALRSYQLADGDILAVGGPGVAEALQSAGFSTVLPSQVRQDPQRYDRKIVAVLQGYGPDVTAADLGEAAIALANGAKWVATNDDKTLPMERGFMPGNGSLLAAVKTTTNAVPQVVGKPFPRVYDLAAEIGGWEASTGAGVGDRLETDIAGARAAGMDAILVLTGVHQWRDALMASPEMRPTHIIPTLKGLLNSYIQPLVQGNLATCGSVRVKLADGQLFIHKGKDKDAQLNCARAALSLLWYAVDSQELSLSAADNLLQEVV